MIYPLASQKKAARNFPAALLSACQKESQERQTQTTLYHNRVEFATPTQLVAVIPRSLSAAADDEQSAVGCGDGRKADPSPRGASATQTARQPQNGSASSSGSQKAPRSGWQPLRPSGAVGCL